MILYHNQKCREIVVVQRAHSLKISEKLGYIPNNAYTIKHVEEPQQHHVIYMHNNASTTISLN